MFGCWCAPWIWLHGLLHFFKFTRTLIDSLLLSYLAKKSRCFNFWVLLVHVAYVACLDIGFECCQQEHSYSSLSTNYTGGAEDYLRRCLAKQFCIRHCVMLWGGYFSSLLHCTSDHCLVRDHLGGTPGQTSWMKDNFHQRWFLLTPVHHSEVHLYIIGFNFTPTCSAAMLVF